MPPCFLLLLLLLLPGSWWPVPVQLQGRVQSVMCSADSSLPLAVVGDLEMGGPIPNGGMKANMDQYYEAHMQEVALNEQGHAAFTRAAGSNLPCPAIDFTGGWNDFMAGVCPRLCTFCCPWVQQLQ